MRLADGTLAASDASAHYREATELTLSHVALGGLTEAAAMDLVANAHCHRLTAGTGHSIRGIVDEAGRVVYPGYYYTKLIVPSRRLLGLHRVWDRVAVEIDVRRYGALLLASRATLSADPPPGRSRDAADAAHDADPATLLACNSFYVDHPGGEKEPVAPKPGTVASLAPLKDAPWGRDVQAVPRIFSDSQSRGSLDMAFEGNLSGAATVRYVPRFGHDMPWGEHVAFSHYATICSLFERDYLQSIAAAAAFPRAALQWSETLSRETVYCATVAEESPLVARVRMRVSSESTRRLPPGRQLAAELESVVDVRRQSDDTLVLSSKATRVVAIPSQLTALNETCRQWCTAVS